MTTNHPLRVAIMGASGRMGCMLIQAVANNPNAVLVGAFVRDNSSLMATDAGEMAGIGQLGVQTSVLDLATHQADVLIDFSLPSALPAVISECQKTNTSLVLGVTGLSHNDEHMLKKASNTLPIVYAGNYAVGVNLSLNLIAITAKTLPNADVEIIECHHKHKQDAPSGTALMLAKTIASARGQSLDDVLTTGRNGTAKRQQGEIGIHAVRGGEVIGEHTVRFFADGEIIKLTHKADHRQIFANGAVQAGFWLQTKVRGLYDMQDVLGLK